MRGIKRLLVAAIICFSVSSCNWITTVPNNPTVADVIDCAKAEVAKVTQTLIAKVSTIVASGGAGWKDELTSLAISSGEEALACAVEQVTKDFTENASAAPNARNSNAGAVNGAAYIKEHNYKFAAGQ